MHHSFGSLPALRDFADRVTFKSMEAGIAQADDSCIIGLDVGSTTTKAVILRTSDDAMLASIYLRTNGDPVQASRECYQSLAEQIKVPIRIFGLGVTGSGRQIASVHAGSDGIVNEIIAHATAAAYYDPEVDTVFEIGGQDAKYTYVKNRVPVDYAMNEACSAGTGSFLEESARETLRIDTLEIAEIAIQSKQPLDFNDQCSAFIGSDIKTAIQEGVSREDIVAGLVYSVCQNYANRVKGSRPVGEKVFMQGGVCYNRAVPIAMAALTGKSIIVPPEPGLMGAFGVALEIKAKLELGLIDKKEFHLRELAERAIHYGKSFVCAGGPEQCDRKCIIKMIRTSGSELPFGGACNLYVNLRRNIRHDVEALDLVRLREQLVFEKYAPVKPKRAPAKKIGILKSLVTHSLYPLYHNFFTELGFEMVVAEQMNQEGFERTGAAFCYPVELAHCFMADLIGRSDVEIIFLPHVLALQVENGIPASVNCPLLQGEPYYLRTAFKELAQKQVLSPTLDFSSGYEEMAEEFIKLGQSLGRDRERSIDSYRKAVQIQTDCFLEMKEIGRRVLAGLEDQPENYAIVLFGRSYSAFTGSANMGTPHKFASRGRIIVPWEFLPFEGEEPVEHMFWSVGQMMLKAARYVQRHPQLFAAYITNFSCGPDSFIISYFRDIMDRKPSLTLELDSHVADAGIDTRVEAFLDVVQRYIELQRKEKSDTPEDLFLAAEVQTQADETFVIDSQGKKRLLTDPDVHVTIVSMGRIHTRLLAAAFRHVGFRTAYLEPPTRVAMNCGRANSTCKECLPYILVAGSILNDIETKRLAGVDSDDVQVYFVPDSSGPCRFGQYHIAIQQLLKKKRISNVALLSLTSDNGYAGLSTRFQNQAWQSVIISDVLSDIYSAILVMADDKKAALKVFDSVLKNLDKAISVSGGGQNIKTVLAEQAKILAAIPRKGDIRDVPTVALLGEIFVRCDGFSRQELVERLAAKGIVVQVAPVSEFMYYCDYLLQKSLYHVRFSAVERMMSTLRSYVKKHYEKAIKTTLAKSGFYEARMLEIDEMIDNVKHLIPPHFTGGEAVLTVASTIHDIVDHVSGVIAIGPFGCMPNRVSEAILVESLSETKLNLSAKRPWVKELMKKHSSLPFLALESDGNPFPQIIEARLELFCLQVLRLHESRQTLKR